MARAEPLESLQLWPAASANRLERRFPKLGRRHEPAVGARAVRRHRPLDPGLERGGGAADRADHLQRAVFVEIDEAELRGHVPEDAVEEDRRTVLAVPGEDHGLEPTARRGLEEADRAQGGARRQIEQERRGSSEGRHLVERRASLDRLPVLQAERGSGNERHRRSHAESAPPALHNERAGNAFRRAEQRHGLGRRVSEEVERERAPRLEAASGRRPLGQRREMRLQHQRASRDLPRVRQPAFHLAPGRHEQTQPSGVDPALRPGGPALAPEPRQDGVGRGAKGGDVEHARPSRSVRSRAPMREVAAVRAPHQSVGAAARILLGDPRQLAPARPDADHAPLGPAHEGDVGGVGRGKNRDDGRLRERLAARAGSRHPRAREQGVASDQDGGGVGRDPDLARQRAGRERVGLVGWQGQDRDPRAPVLLAARRQRDERDQDREDDPAHGLSSRHSSARRAR